MKAFPRPSDGDTRPCPNVGTRWSLIAGIPSWQSAWRWGGSDLRWAIASGTNGRGCAATEAVIIESWSELRDAKIRETKNRQGADDAVTGISRRNGDRIWCGRGQHRAARIRALL
jgi:hypothetical protein